MGIVHSSSTQEFIDRLRSLVHNNNNGNICYVRDMFSYVFIANLK